MYLQDSGTVCLCCFGSLPLSAYEKNTCFTNILHFVLSVATVPLASPKCKHAIVACLNYSDAHSNAKRKRQQ